MLDYVIEGDLVEENYGLQGRIISKFDHVINIETTVNKGFAVTDSKVVMAPYHVKIPDYIFKKIINKVKKQNKIQISRNEIVYNKRKFTYKKKNIFKGKINDCSAIEKGKLIDWTEKVIKDTVGLGSLDQTILKYKKLINNLDDHDLTVLQQEFYKKLKNIREEKISVNELIGLGIGLTPTGDDFIVGYLSAIEANLIEDKLNIVNQISVAEIFDKTTRVSALHLKGALNHRYNEKLVDIYKNLNQGREQYIKYAKKLIKVGNSSGLDMLTGIYWGLIM